MRTGVLNDAEVAPETGVVVTPEAPLYHWKVGEVPDAVTVSVAVPPLLMVVDTGWLVIVGGMRTLTVAVLVSAVPAELVARAQ